jgi:hypothetical protein
MPDDRLTVSVTFDAAKGYVAMVPDLAESITALSLTVLLRRIEERLLPDTVQVKLVLDRAARLERDQRRCGGASRASDAGRAEAKSGLRTDRTRAVPSLGRYHESPIWSLVTSSHPGQTHG